MGNSSFVLQLYSQESQVQSQSPAPRSPGAFANGIMPIQETVAFQ